MNARLDAIERDLDDGTRTGEHAAALLAELREALDGALDRADHLIRERDHARLAVVRVLDLADELADHDPDAYLTPEQENEVASWIRATVAGDVGALVVADDRSIAERYYAALGALPTTEDVPR